MDRQFSAMEAISSSQQHTEVMVNNDYWYEERDIQQLLKYRVRELQPIPSLEEPIFIAPCLDDAVHYGLKAYLADEAKEHVSQRQRHLLIPYNLGFSHWVGIHLHIEGQKVTATYMDPLSVAPSLLARQGIWELSVPDAIGRQIREIYSDADIRQQMYYNQHAEKTKSSCGVLTIENLVVACYQPPQQSVTTLEQINAFRLAHIKLMQAQGNADFYQRQKENKPTVPSAFEQMQYIQQSNSLHLSAAEWQQLEQIQNSIKQLSAEKQQTLIKALQQPIGDEGSAHRNYLDALRNLMQQFVQETTTHSSEREALSTLVQVFFQRTRLAYLQNPQSDFKVPIELLQLIGSFLTPYKDKGSKTEASLSPKENSSVTLAQLFGTNWQEYETKGKKPEVDKVYKAIYQFFKRETLMQLKELGYKQARRNNEVIKWSNSARLDIEECFDESSRIKTIEFWEQGKPSLNHFLLVNVKGVGWYFVGRDYGHKEVLGYVKDIEEFKERANEWQMLIPNALRGWDEKKRLLKSIGYVLGHTRPKVFISYAWPSPNFPETRELDEDHKHYIYKIAKQLRQAGLAVFLDIWFDRGSKRVSNFIEKAFQESHIVLIMWTKLYEKKYQLIKESRTDDISKTIGELTREKPDYVVYGEMEIMQQLALHTSRIKDKIHTVILEGEGEATPLSLKGIPAYLRESDDCFDGLLKLLKDIYHINQDDKQFKKINNTFLQGKGKFFETSIAVNNFLEKLNSYQAAYHLVLETVQHVNGFGEKFINLLLLEVKKLTNFPEVNKRLHCLSLLYEIRVQQNINESSDRDVKQGISDCLNLLKPTIDAQDFLIYTTEIGAIGVARYLLMHKTDWPIDINRQSNKTTPKIALQIATSYGYTDFVKLLLDNQAGVKEGHAGDCGQTALHMACEKGHEAIAKMLLEQPNSSEIINLKQGACLGENTALHLAAQYGHLNIVKTLVEKGAEINVRNYEQNTTLHCLANNHSSHFNRKQENYLEISKILLARGADIKTENNNKQTVSQLAEKNELYHVLELMSGDHKAQAEEANSSKPGHVTEKTLTDIDYHDVDQVLREIIKNDEIIGYYNGTCQYLLTKKDDKKIFEYTRLTISEDKKINLEPYAGLVALLPSVNMRELTSKIPVSPLESLKEAILSDEIKGNFKKAIVEKNKFSPDKIILIIIPYWFEIKKKNNFFSGIFTLLVEIEVLIGEEKACFRTHFRKEKTNGIKDFVKNIILTEFQSFLRELHINLEPKDAMVLIKENKSNFISPAIMLVDDIIGIIKNYRVHYDADNDHEEKISKYYLDIYRGIKTPKVKAKNFDENSLYFLVDKFVVKSYDPELFKKAVKKALEDRSNDEERLIWLKKSTPSNEHIFSFLFKGDHQDILNYLNTIILSYYSRNPSTIEAVEPVSLNIYYPKDEASSVSLDDNVNRFRFFLQEISRITPKKDIYYPCFNNTDYSDLIDAISISDTSEQHFYEDNTCEKFILTNENIERVVRTYRALYAHDLDDTSSESRDEWKRMTESSDQDFERTRKILYGTLFYIKNNESPEIENKRKFYSALITTCISHIEAARVTYKIGYIKFEKTISLKKTDQLIDVIRVIIDTMSSNKENSLDVLRNKIFLLGDIFEKINFNPIKNEFKFFDFLIGMYEIFSPNVGFIDSNQDQKERFFDISGYDLNEFILDGMHWLSDACKKLNELIKDVKKSDEISFILFSRVLWVAHNIYMEIKDFFTFDDEESEMLARDQDISNKMIKIFGGFVGFSNSENPVQDDDKITGISRIIEDMTADLVFDNKEKTDVISFLKRYEKIIFPILTETQRIKSSQKYQLYSIFLKDLGTASFPIFLTIFSWLEEVSSYSRNVGRYINDSRGQEGIKHLIKLSFNFINECLKTAGYHEVQMDFKTLPKFSFFPYQDVGLINFWRLCLKYIAKNLKRTMERNKPNELKLIENLIELISFLTEIDVKDGNEALERNDKIILLVFSIIECHYFDDNLSWKFCHEYNQIFQCFLSINTKKNLVKFEDYFLIFKKIADFFGLLFDNNSFQDFSNYGIFLKYMQNIIAYSEPVDFDKVDSLSHFLNNIISQQKIVVEPDEKLELIFSIISMSSKTVSDFISGLDKFLNSSLDPSEAPIKVEEKVNEISEILNSFAMAIKAMDTPKCKINQKRISQIGSETLKSIILYQYSKLTVMLMDVITASRDDRINEFKKIILYHILLATLKKSQDMKKKVVDILILTPFLFLKFPAEISLDKITKMINAANGAFPLYSAYNVKSDADSTSESYSNKANAEISEENIIFGLNDVVRNRIEFDLIGLVLQLFFFDEKNNSKVLTLKHNIILNEDNDLTISSIIKRTLERFVSDHGSSASSSIPEDNKVSEDGNEVSTNNSFLIGTVIKIIFDLFNTYVELERFSPEEMSIWKDLKKVSQVNVMKDSMRVLDGITKQSKESQGSEYYKLQPIMLGLENSKQKIIKKLEVTAELSHKDYVELMHANNYGYILQQRKIYLLMINDGIKIIENNIFILQKNHQLFLFRDIFEQLHNDIINCFSPSANGKMFYKTFDIDPSFLVWWLQQDDTAYQFEFLAMKARLIIKSHFVDENVNPPPTGLPHFKLWFKFISVFHEIINDEFSTNFISNNSGNIIDFLSKPENIKKMKNIYKTGFDLIDFFGWLRVNHKLIIDELFSIISNGKYKYQERINSLHLIKIYSHLIGLVTTIEPVDYVSWFSDPADLSTANRDIVVAIKKSIINALKNISNENETLIVRSELLENLFTMMNKIYIRLNHIFKNKKNEEINNFLSEVNAGYKSRNFLLPSDEIGSYKMHKEIKMQCIKDDLQPITTREVELKTFYLYEHVKKPYKDKKGRFSENVDKNDDVQSPMTILTSFSKKESRK